MKILRNVSFNKGYQALKESMEIEENKRIIYGASIGEWKSSNSLISYWFCLSMYFCGTKRKCEDAHFNSSQLPCLGNDNKTVRCSSPVKLLIFQHLKVQEWVYTKWRKWYGRLPTKVEYFQGSECDTELFLRVGKNKHRACCKSQETCPEHIPYWTRMWGAVKTNFLPPILAFHRHDKLIIHYFFIVFQKVDVMGSLGTIVIVELGNLQFII